MSKMHYFNYKFSKIASSPPQRLINLWFW